MLCSISHGFLNVKIFTSSLPLGHHHHPHHSHSPHRHQGHPPSVSLPIESTEQQQRSQDQLLLHICSVKCHFHCVHFSLLDFFLAKSLLVIQQEVTTTTHFAVCTNWHTATSHQQTLEEVILLDTDRGTCLLLHSDLWTEELTVKFVLRWLQSVICAAEIRTVFLWEWCYLNCWNRHRTHQSFSEQELTTYV